MTLSGDLVLNQRVVSSFFWQLLSLKYKIRRKSSWRATLDFICAREYTFRLISFDAEVQWPLDNGKEITEGNTRSLLFFSPHESTDKYISRKSSLCILATPAVIEKYTCNSQLCTPLKRESPLTIFSQPLSYTQFFPISKYATIASTVYFLIHYSPIILPFDAM